MIFHLSYCELARSLLYAHKGPVFGGGFFIRICPQPCLPNATGQHFNSHLVKVVNRGAHGHSPIRKLEPSAESGQKCGDK